MYAYAYGRPPLMRPESVSAVSSSDPGFAGVGVGGSGSGSASSGGIPVSPTGVGYAWQGGIRDSLQPIRKGEQRQGVRVDQFARHGLGEGGSGGQVRHYEDSGLRMGGAPPLMDVPPVYTAD